MTIKKIVSVSRIVLSWIYVLCLLLIIMCSFYQREKGTGYQGKYQANVVLTGSMEPTIKVGSLTISKQIPFNELKKNDVIVLNNNEEKMTHRIRSIEEEVVKTKGDANAYNDAPNQKKYITGKVIFVIPKVGYLFLMLKTISGKIALLSTVLNLVLLDYFIKLLIMERSKQKGVEEVYEKANIIE